MKHLTKRVAKKALKTSIGLLPKSSYKNHLLKKHCNVISNIVVIVGQNCTLKCRDCANFSPYLANQLPFYPYDEIVADIQELIKESQIAYLQFQGGEFFLHPKCQEILEFSVNQDRIWSICIATNGTIIPKESMLKILQNNKVIVRISDYGEVNQKRADKLETLLDEHNIKMYRRTEYRGAGLWSKCGDKDMKKLSQKQMQKVFDSCTFATECLTMENGFITRCSRATIAHLMQNFQLTKTDGIVVRPNAKRAFDTITTISGGGGKIPSFTHKNLVDFIQAKSPISACYYCYGSEGIQVTPGEQMTKEQLQAIEIHNKQNKTGNESYGKNI